MPSGLPGKPQHGTELDATGETKKANEHMHTLAWQQEWRELTKLTCSGTVTPLEKTALGHNQKWDGQIDRDVHASIVYTGEKPVLEKPSCWNWGKLT